MDAERSEANSRLVALRMTFLTLRWMENWRRKVRDYDSVMILLAVVAISAGRLLRSNLQPIHRNMRNPMPEGTLSSCNISSIASATGLNRETTRRKVAKLVEQGFLVRSPDRSIRFPAGYLQQEDTAELVRRQLESFIRVANELAQDEVFSAWG